jgi:hypothetical protein
MWYPEQREVWEADMAEAWRQFEIRDPAYVQSVRDFLNKRIKPYPSTEASKEKGIRLKVPDFKPVPEHLKRKPN